MVRLPSVCQPRVVVGCDRVDHVGIHLVMPGKHEALRNDRAHMVGAVCRIERPVAGNDLGLDVGLQFFGWFHRCKSNIFIRIARLTGDTVKRNGRLFLSTVSFLYKDAILIGLCCYLNERVCL